MDSTLLLITYGAAFSTGAVAAGIASAYWVRRNLEAYENDGCVGQLIYPFALGLGVPGSALLGGAAAALLVATYQVFGWTGPLLTVLIAGAGIAIRLKAWRALAVARIGRGVERAADSGEEHARAYLQAAKNGDLQSVTRFLDSGIYVDTCFIGDETHGYTALMYAAKRGDLTMIRLLLDRKADPTQSNEIGQTPLDLAERSGQVEAALLLRQILVGRQP